MSDDSFIREVDEELRSDRMQDFWSRYGKLVIAGAVAVVAATAGYRYYDYYTSSKAAASGDAFMQAVRLSSEKKDDEALAALAKLENESKGTYRTVARMRTASELLKKGDTAGALKAYDSIAADDTADENMKAFARIRAGMILVDTGSVTEVEARVGQLAKPGQPYRSSAREAVGLAYFKAGDLENAFKQFKSVYDDGEAPQGIKQRMRILMDVIASQGGPVREG